MRLSALVLSNVLTASAFRPSLLPFVRAMSTSTTCASHASNSILRFTYELDPQPPNLPFSTGATAALLPPAPFTTNGLFPSLYATLATMSIGDTVTVNDVKLADSNPDMLITIPFAALEESNIAVSSLSTDSKLTMSGGIVADVTIIDPAAGMVTLDANSKLSRVAGTTLTVTLDGVSTVAVNDVGDWEKWSDTRYNTATFAGGCFWGLELLFQRIPGVVATKVGYTQGAVVDPSYEAVCGGSTGHTEAVAVVFDTSVASYNKLVADFIDRLGGDATKLNQVGNDRGTQYRHGIYAHSPEQLASASVALDQIENCVTECKMATKFYDAKEYHQQYLQKGGQSAKKEDTETIRCYG